MSGANLVAAGWADASVALCPPPNPLPPAGGGTAFVQGRPFRFKSGKGLDVVAGKLNGIAPNPINSANRKKIIPPPSLPAMTVGVEAIAG